MAVTLSTHLADLGWSNAVAIPAELGGLMAALVSDAWPPAAGTAVAKVAAGNALPGFATLSLDSGLTVQVELSRQPTGTGFRADILIAVPNGGTGPGITLPGLIGGTPQSSGTGRSLQRWIQSTGVPVRAGLHAVIRIEGTPGATATMGVVPSADQPDGVVRVTVDPPHALLPGESFGLHLPEGIILDDSATAAPAPAGTPHASDAPAWRGVSVRGAGLFLPRGVPYVGGTLVPVELEIGAPTGIDARTEVDVPPADGRPHLHGVVEWHDPAALSLAACVPTLVDLGAEFDLDSVATPPVGSAGGAVLAAGKPLLLRARYARDTRTSPPAQRFDVTVQGEGPDGLLRVKVDDGLTGNLGARVFVTAAALAGALAGDTPAGTAPSGDNTSAELAALLGVASVLSSFCREGKVVVHGVTVIGTVGPGAPTLILDVDYSVDVLVKTFTYGGLSIGMQDDVPMRVRYRQVRLEIDPAAEGLKKFHISYSQASMDVEDPGRWQVPGAPFDVTGTRAGHGSTWFEIDLRFTLDLGPVKVSGATIRATFDGGPEPDVTLRGLDVSLTVPGVIKGSGRLALADHALEAALAVDVDIEPVGVGCSAYLAIANDRQAGTMIVIDLDFDLPGAVPLGPTGLGLYSIGGMFGINARPRDAVGDPVEYQLKWTPEQTEVSAGDLMFGFAVVVGTLPDMGFAFSAAGRILLTVPEFALRMALDAGFLSERRRLAAPLDPDGSDQPVGSGAITGVLAYDRGTVLVGVRGSVGVSRLLTVTVPADGVFPTNSSDWWLHIGSDGAGGRTPGPVRAHVLPELLNLGADAYLMVHGKDIPDVGGRNDFDLHGFAVAFGARFHAVYGAGLIWLELGAEAQFGLSTAPLILRGHGSLEGTLHLGPVSIGASSTIDGRLGPAVDDSWLRFQVKGRVHLFFFTISGSVTITIGKEKDAAKPQLGTWPMPEMSLCDHNYHEAGTAPSGAIPPPPDKLPVVWPDTIPLLKFPVLPVPDPNFVSDQFTSLAVPNEVTTPGGPKAWSSSYDTVAKCTGRTGTGELSYTYTLTGLRLIRPDGRNVPGPLDAAWQAPKIVGAAAQGGVAGELALLTWDTALWTKRLSDGGANQPTRPLDTIVNNCTIVPQATSGWALGASAAESGDRWRMPPEAGPGDALASRFWVDVDVAYGKQAVHWSLLGIPVQTGYLPGGPITFPAPLNGGKRTFRGALAVPGLTALGPWTTKLGVLRTTLSVVGDTLAPEYLILLTNAKDAKQISVIGGGTWKIETTLPGATGTTVVVFACTGSGSLISQVVVQYPVGTAIALLGLRGRTKKAQDAAAAAAAGAAAAAAMAAAKSWPRTTVPNVPKTTVPLAATTGRRTLLEPDTTYGVEVALHCHAERSDNGTSNDFDTSTTFWFHTAAPPPSPPPEPTDSRYLRLVQKAQDHFDAGYLQRYLLGYTPSDRTSNFFRDDPVGAHFNPDHVGDLAAKYGHKIALVARRTDLPPGTPVSQPYSIAATFMELWADANDKLPTPDRRLYELDALGGGHCRVPHTGATYGGDAGLAPGATYELAVQVPAEKADFGIPLPGVVFTTSRYRNPREQVADLGFSAASGAATGDLPVTEPAGLAGLVATAADSDDALGVLLDQLGLSVWAPPSSEHGRSSLLWSRSVAAAGPWRLTGVLLESPEPLERPARMRLGALQCTAVAFDVVRRNATGTRVLYLTRTPVVPLGSVPSLLSLTVIERPEATSPAASNTPPETSFVMHAVTPASPAFAEEI